MNAAVFVKIEIEIARFLIFTIVDYTIPQLAKCLLRMFQIVLNKYLQTFFTCLSKSTQNAKILEKALDLLA